MIQFLQPTRLFRSVSTVILALYLFSSVSASSKSVQFTVSPQLSTRTILPVVYNPVDVSSYFRHHPQEVLQRAVQVTSEVGSILSAVGEGLISGETESQRKLRIASAIKDSMVNLGPTFIKLGQALSSRQDLIGMEGIASLQSLQDAIPCTFTTAEAKQIIKDDFRNSPEAAALLPELLSTMSAESVAAASLGQVYRASINGTQLAIKIQRPDLRERVAVDFFVFRILADLLSRMGVVRSDGVGAVDEYASRLFEGNTCS